MPCREELETGTNEGAGDKLHNLATSWRLIAAPPLLMECLSTKTSGKES